MEQDGTHAADPPQEAPQPAGGGTPADLGSAPTGPVARGPFAGREDAYRQLERAALYLRALEPHSPAPYLALRAVDWGEKTLNELIREFVRNGLDLEALSNLLGLDDADSGRTQ